MKTNRQVKKVYLRSSPSLIVREYVGLLACIPEQAFTFFPFFFWYELPTEFPKLLCLIRVEDTAHRTAQLKEKNREREKEAFLVYLWPYFRAFFTRQWFQASSDKNYSNDCASVNSIENADQDLTTEYLSIWLSSLLSFQNF